MEKRLIVIIGCDCDPDRAKYGGENWRLHRGEYIWLGIEKGIRHLKERLRGIQTGFDNPLKFTWCVRSDLQIEEIYGDPGWCLKEFSSLWKKLEEEGDEIGWHPHLARWSSKDRVWFQEIYDEEWTRNCISKGFIAFRKNWGKSPLSSRMGWVFHNNLTIEEISILGIRVDFSAIPGLKKKIISKRAITKVYDYADWEGSPAYPYHPSRLDYRIPSKGGGFPVWEIPCVPLHSTLLMWPYNLKAVMSGKGNILLKPIFPATLTIFPVLFKRALHHWLRVNKFKETVFLATYFHSDELLSLGLEFFIENLACIQKEARLQKMDVCFLTASELLGILGEGD